MDIHGVMNVEGEDDSDFCKFSRFLIFSFRINVSFIFFQNSKFSHPFFHKPPHFAEASLSSFAYAMARNNTSRVWLLPQQTAARNVTQITDDHIMHYRVVVKLSHYVTLLLLCYSLWLFRDSAFLDELVRLCVQKSIQHGCYVSFVPRMTIFS